MGYDFIISNLPKNYKTAAHLHKKANELCYLVSGVVEAVVYRSNKQERTTIKTGEWIYIRKSDPHTIEAIEDSSLIIVAKPPVFERTSNLIKGKIRHIFKLK